MFNNYTDAEKLVQPANAWAWACLLALLCVACRPSGPAGQPPNVESPKTERELKTMRPLTNFKLRSPEVAEGGDLPKEYTCDGASATLPLQWDSPPSGTQSIAVIMHHIPGPGDSHWYWVLYDIPSTVMALAKNSTGVGKLGSNSVNGTLAYAPPCSKGPGPKKYTYTVYALSSPPIFSVPAAQIDRDALLDAMSGHVLASAELNVIYSR